jgi:hypothetical protein
MQKRQLIPCSPSPIWKLCTLLTHQHLFKALCHAHVGSFAYATKDKQVSCFLQYLFLQSFRNPHFVKGKSKK